MNIRPDRFPVPLVMMISLVVFISNSFAQGPRDQETSKKSTGQAPMAEPDKEIRIRNDLATLLSGVGVRVDKNLPPSDAQTHKEIRVRWLSPEASDKASSGSLPGVVSVVASTRREGSPPRERSLELSANQVLVIGLDKNNGLRWWRLILDPRLVRSETSDATGGIRCEDHYLAKVDFVVACPDEPGIKELRFYHPSWTGKEFRLELLSTLPVE